MEIILITNSFPYQPGEQFLETEIKYYTDCKLTILPAHGHEEKRFINASIVVDDYLFKNSDSNKSNKILSLLKNIFSKYFYKEFFIFNSFNFKKLKPYNSSMNIYRMYYNLFDSYFKYKENLHNLTVYTYWNNEITYALQSLKNKYNYKLISRIHGYDIYEERRIGGYMPLKRQFTKNIDKIFTITNSANKYLHDIYGFDYGVLELSRLGVEDKNINTKANKDNILHIVSCSFLTEVKQVHKIIEALAIVGKKNSTVRYIWTHIGDGELYSFTSNLASKLLSKLSNVRYDFKGRMNNEDVYKFYQVNKVDVFINVSKSEGVPVSIMEAMSCHIPVIAPNIGGISDMVISGKNGILLSDQCKVNEIVLALEKKEYFHNINTRSNAYNLFTKMYEASHNYQLFINKIIKGRY